MQYLFDINQPECQYYTIGMSCQSSDIKLNLSLNEFLSLSTAALTGYDTLNNLNASPFKKGVK